CTIFPHFLSFFLIFHFLLFFFFFSFLFFFFNDPAPTDIYTLSLHDALPISVAFVYLAMAAAVALAILALATVVVQQTRSAAHRVDNYFTVESGHPNRTGAEQDLAKLQHFLDRHHLSSLHVERQGQKFLNQVGTKDVQKYTSKALRWAEGAGVAVVTLLFDAFLVVVVSIYMLLDMQRLTEAVDRRFPPRGRGGLIVRMEQAVANYVKGQLLLSLIIGLSSGVGLWILGIVGLMP